LCELNHTGIRLVLTAPPAASLTSTKDKLPFLGGKLKTEMKKAVSGLQAHPTDASVLLVLYSDFTLRSCVVQGGMLTLLWSTTLEWSGWKAPTPIVRTSAVPFAHVLVCALTPGLLPGWAAGGAAASHNDRGNRCDRRCTRLAGSLGASWPNRAKAAFEALAARLR
jgi:hypothetical protein